MTGGKITDVKLSEFVEENYKSYWDHANKRGKNGIDPREQLSESAARVIASAIKSGLTPTKEVKTVQISGVAFQIHPHSTASIDETVKGLASTHKSEPAVRVLQGIGNFGDLSGDSGAAARYTAVSGTPLLSAIAKDLQYTGSNSEETGIDQPNYVSSPLPFNLILGASSIGAGKSCFIAERPARKVIEWIESLRKSNWSESVPAPDATSSTGCRVTYNPQNGYFEYNAVIHRRVDKDDLSKKGGYDVITALPPDISTYSVMLKLEAEFPKRKFEDASGKGNPVKIVTPRGLITDELMYKLGLKRSRKEQILIWHEDEKSLMHSTIHTIAKEWFEDRSGIVTLRLNDQISDLQSQNHKIDLIETFANEKMIDWDEKDVVTRFEQLNPGNGESDSKIVLSMPARAFLPENIGKNKIEREKNRKSIEVLEDKVANVGDVVIEEAYDIIEKQEAFFTA